MKLTSQTINKSISFLSSLDSNVLVLSGAEEQFAFMNDTMQDVKCNIVENFNKSLTSYEVIVINGDEIADESLILNEINTVSFFSQHKIVICTRLKTQIAEQVCVSMDGSSVQNICLMWCVGQIKKNAKKTSFENSQNIIIVDCYADNDKSLEIFASDILKQNNFKITPNALKYLVEKCKGNRFYLKNELEKIMTYAFGAKNITIDDVEELIFEGSSENVFAKCDDLLLLNAIKITTIFDKLRQSKGYDGSIAGMIHLIKNNLMFLRSIIVSSKNNRSSIEDELKAELGKNRAFFLKIDIVRSQLKVWNLPKINNFLLRLSQYEVLCRLNHCLANTIMENCFLQELSN